MVVKMMKWRPWPPPPVTRRYEVRLVVRRLELGDPSPAPAPEGDAGKLRVEVRWKGPKVALSSLRRPAVKTNFTTEIEGSGRSAVDWDGEEFRSDCAFSICKDNAFHPWEIGFTVSNSLNQGSKNKIIVGTASVNLSEHVSAAEEKELELNIPLTNCGVSVEPCPILTISLSFLELRTGQETAEPVERSIVPVPLETVSPEKDELSALKAGLRKVKILTGYVSSRKAKKACREEDGSEGRGSTKSDGDYNYPFDSDSPDDFEDGESDEGKADITVSVRKSFSYGPLAYANYAGGLFCSNTRINGGDEDWVYYSNRKADVAYANVEDSSASVSEPSLPQSSKRGLLSWKKRKLSFRSPKPKGEPLLKRAYGEEGGDDIDFDRRQLSSDESLSLERRHKTEEDSSAHRSSVSDFGDDNFAVGVWEKKEVTSRDGHMKLQTQVFFASIDQRSERAAGESACTALVAVVADWLQNNNHELPIKSQFDSLIRDGSSEWRRLCQNEAYRERFPDRHFDLETVLQAKIRPLSVSSQKSFIGFFHPENTEEGSFDFLRGAMSFDNIWDEISSASADPRGGSGEPHVYIVSWNDHFFVLKAEPDAFYIVDTLGERLFEGCDQAYILKFDSKTTIHKMPSVAQASDEKTGDESASSETKADEPTEILCRGKESCREYIKSFLAAIPLRELQADMKKGLASAPIHQRLQIEFNFTRPFQPSETEASEVEVAT